MRHAKTEEDIEATLEWFAAQPDKMAAVEALTREWVKLCNVRTLQGFVAGALAGVVLMWVLS